MGVAHTQQGSASAHRKGIIPLTFACPFEMVKRSKTQERQGAREQPEGVYYGVNDRGLPQRNEVFRSGFFVLSADLAL